MTVKLLLKCFLGITGLPKTRILTLNLENTTRSKSVPICVDHNVYKHQHRTRVASFSKQADKYGVQWASYVK
jgi:hypothetical protein